ncbi:hypothetical protein EDF66_101687 [Sphingobacterium sp. JUb20]|nr:hypothetical protein [Sphingobacterium sp. JUb21]TCR10872.1 hypothetical protein EDF66_101687 [Sphingobacterium sp. JUb20]
MSEPVKYKFKMSSTDSLILCLVNELYRDGKHARYMFKNSNTSSEESLTNSLNLLQFYQYLQQFEHN